MVPLPVVFRFLVDDIFLFIYKLLIVNYTVDGPRYSSEKKYTKSSFYQGFSILSNWIYNFFMVLNPDECSNMLFGSKNELQTISYVARLLLNIARKKKY